MAIEILNSIDRKVTELYDLVVSSGISQGLTQRLEKLESALFSGSGQGIVVTSASIANVLQSTNYVAGSAGWKIWKTGAAEFEEVTVRGTIHATAGDFLGPITIGAGGSLSSGQTAYDTGTGFWVEYNSGTPRFSIGNSAGNKLLWDGSSLSVTGSITATSGTITGTLYVGTSPDRIIIDGSAKTIGSEGFVSGSSGWRITGTGDAEFLNVIVRGSLRSSILSYSDVTAYAGSLIVTKSAGALYSNFTTYASPTVFTVNIQDGATHTRLFDIDDILRITNGVDISWLLVTGYTDKTTYWEYSCTLANGTAGKTYYKGTAIADYGQSGDGGLFITADAANAPYLSIFTHAGAPYTTMTTQVRIGNLNGVYGYTNDYYGFGCGDYTTGNYIAFDGNTSTFVLSAGQGGITLTDDGVQLLVGDVTRRYLKWNSIIDGDTCADISTTEDTGTGYTTLWLYSRGPNTSYAQLSLGTTYMYYAQVGETAFLYGRAAGAQDENFIVGRAGASKKDGDTAYITARGYEDTVGAIASQLAIQNLYAGDDVQTYQFRMEGGAIGACLWKFQTYRSDTATTTDLITYNPAGPFLLFNAGVIAVNYLGVNLGVNLYLDGDWDTYLKCSSDDSLDVVVGNTYVLNMTAAGLYLSTGARVNEFSLDTNLTDGSGTAVPTEYAVKTYAQTYPCAQVFRTTAQSIPNSTWTEMICDGEAFDWWTMHNTTTGRISPAIAALYWWGGQVQCVMSGANQYLSIGMGVNGVPGSYGVVSSTRSYGAGNFSVSASGLGYMDAVSYLYFSLYIWQGTGAAANTVAGYCSQGCAAVRRS